MVTVICKGLQNSFHSRPNTVVEPFLETARYSYRKVRPRHKRTRDNQEAAKAVQQPDSIF